MDATIAKIVESRKKSIGTLKAEIEALDVQVKATKSTAAAAALSGIAKVKRQRLANLERELAGLLEVDGQVQVPGTADVPARRPGGR